MQSETAATETAAPAAQQDIDIEPTPNGAGDANVAPTAGDEKMDNAESQPKKRPRIEMATEPRKKGRSVFGMVLGTLKKAKDEDKARASTETAKRRAEVEDRLARELTRRKDQVRMESESKKQRSKAHQREEELALKDSMIRQRQATLPALANFLLTTDNIPSDFTFDPSADANMADEAAPSTKQASQFLPIPPRAAGPNRPDGPPVYFLPAVLLPQQKAFLEKRQAETKRTLAAEEEAWKIERQKGLDEIQNLKQGAQEAQQAARAADTKTDDGKPSTGGEPASTASAVENDANMDVVEGEQ